MGFLRLFQPSTPDRPLGGRYKVISELGVGGFGRTYLAEDLHLPGHPHCVIKQLHPQSSDPHNLQIARRLFDTEAKTLYQLGSHDQIPRLLAHFEDQQEFYLAQELVEGNALTEELVWGQNWTEPQAIALLQDVLKILSFVHQQNVIHRDIKPSNLIRRRQDGKMVLIDFGAVKQVTTALANPDSKPTQTIAIGTQGYMPNEQVAGNPRFCSDIYAVGIIAIQALTGVTPRQLEEDPRTGEIQWRDRALQVSASLATVLDRMVCYDFRSRYPTAVEALVAVQTLAPLEGSELNAASEKSLAPLPPAPPQSSPAITAASPPQAAQSVSHSDPTASFAEPAPPAITQSSNPQADLNQVATAPWLEAHRSSTMPTQVAASSPPPTRISRGKLLPSLVGLAAIALLVPLMRIWNAPESDSPVATRAPITTPAASASVNLQSQAANLLTQAEQSRQAKQYQQALDRYEAAIELNSESPEAQWGRCFSLNALQKPDEAIAACDAALALNPNYAEALWSKGYALDQLQQYRQAVALYEQAIALKPDFAGAWSNKGATLLKLNQTAEAIAALDKAVELDPNLAEAWNNRGAALWSQRRFEEAIASVDRAIQLQPDYQDALSLRQQMREKLGR